MAWLSGNRAAGIGGILRVCNSNIRIVFSKSIGVADSNLAERFAAFEAFKLFISSLWVSTHKLLLESDSTNAVMWISNPSSAPWRFRWLINNIENIKRLIPNWSVNDTLQEANVVVDILANAGINRVDGFILVQES
ncbi:hypothetical protein PTKIN_Ptkin14bG0062000 [Pterospermum kingtungense]